MSNNRLTFAGLEELRQALRDLPADLVAEASPLVTHAARNAEGAIRASYPSITGDLRNGLEVEILSPGRFAAGAIVRNRSKYASWYEYGTAARHYFTKRGKRKAVGAMPAGKRFVPRIEEYRRRMYEDLKGLLTRHGLIVTGG
jgi:hypothetical protein